MNPIAIGARYRLPSGSVVEVAGRSAASVFCLYLGPTGGVRSRNSQVNFTVAWLGRYGLLLCKPLVIA